MKFDKPSSGTLNTVDDVVLANRFEERRARLDAERNSPKIDPVMRKRVMSMYGELLSSMSMAERRRPRNKWEREPAKTLSPEEMAEFWGKNPVKLSDAALARSTPQQAG